MVHVDHQKPLLELLPEENSEMVDVDMLELPEENSETKMVDVDKLELPPYENSETKMVDVDKPPSKCALVPQPAGCSWWMSLATPLGNMNFDWVGVGPVEPQPLPAACQGITKAIREREVCLSWGP